MNKASPNDEKIQRLVAKLKKLTDDRKLEKNWRKEWFSNNQISRLREIYETKGYETAKVFQAGNINQRDNKFKRRGDEALLEALKMIQQAKLDKEISSYILGNLNNIIDMKEESKGGSR